MADQDRNEQRDEELLARIGEVDDIADLEELLAAAGVGEDGVDGDGDEADLEFGAVKVTESGLTLNLGGGGEDTGEDADAPVERPVTAQDLAELAQVEEELNERWPETKIDPSLERIEMLMDLLGSPQRSFPAIHVAGTNGKTSTVRMIEALLRAFHRRTGRTTSPHLQLVTERIGIDGAPVHPADYVRIWREIQPYVEMVDERAGLRMSKFEVLTAIAYAAFADAPVEVEIGRAHV